MAHPCDGQAGLIGRILQADGRGRTIIFCKTKRAAQRLTDELLDRGFATGAVHGDLGQAPARSRCSSSGRRSGRAGRHRRGARGIDVEAVTHVINYTCPDDEKMYLHRIGRTARAGAEGVAVTLVDWDDMQRWKMIDKALGLPFAEPIETYSTSDHVFTGLGIPAMPPVASNPPPPNPAATTGRERSRDSSGQRRDGARSGKPAPEGIPRGQANPAQWGCLAVASAPASDSPNKPKRRRKRTRRPAEGSGQSSEATD